MITFITPFEKAIYWAIDIVETLSGVWSKLATPLFTIGDVEISFIGVFSLGVISAVLIAKLIDVVNPIG